MLIGYARVSSEDQNPEYQLDALNAAGCAQVFQDRATGSTYDRAGLDQALAALTPGSTLVVWKLDRLGRSLAHARLFVGGGRAAVVCQPRPGLVGPQGHRSWRHPA